MNWPKLAFWKKDAETGAQRVTQENQSRFNPLYAITPDRFVRALDSYNAGYVADMCKIVEAYKQRDDAILSNSRKAYASVARCPHTVSVVEGYEDDPAAQDHVDVLTRFWANVRVTSAFNRNETGSLRLLQKQMATAIGYGHAAHEIIWKPKPDGTLGAEFVFVPPWMFENTTGRMRYLATTSSVDGVDMPEGGWLVTTGDAIGIASGILAMSKRLSLNDWLSFCERCGQPGLHAKTSAQFNSPEWRNVASVVGAFGRKWSAVTGPDTEINTVSLNTSAAPWPPLVEMCSRAIAALWRGSDLATMSRQGDSTGTLAQKDEKNILEEDFCEAISETLHDQVSRFVIAHKFGNDVEPLAYLQIRPTTTPNVEMDIKIDQHLAGHGVKLSGNDALARYGRVAWREDDQGDTPLTPAASTGSQNTEQGTQKFEMARPGAALANEAAAVSRASVRRATMALRRDLGPLVREAGRLTSLREGDAQDAAVAAFRGKLEELPRGDALANELEAQIAEAFVQGAAPKNAPVANEDDYVRDDAGRFASTGGGGKAWHAGNHSPKLQSLLDGAPRRITVSEANAALAEEIHTSDPNGKKVRFGENLKRHIEGDGHNPKDTDGRKTRLLHAVDAVKDPDAISDSSRGEKRTVYQKRFDGFSMVAIADEKGEINEVFNIIPRRGGNK